MPFVRKPYDLPLNVRVHQLRKDNPRMSRQAARSLIMKGDKKNDAKPNPTTRTVIRGFGDKQTYHTMRLGHDHPATPYVPGCKYQRALLERLGVR